MKYEKKHKESKFWFMGCLLIIFLFVCLVLQSGCGTIKGIAHDVSWTADKLDKSIVVPDWSTDKANKDRAVSR